MSRILKHSGTTKGERSKTNKKSFFHTEKYKIIVNYLNDNAYFEVGGNIFRQVIDIPIGTDPDTFMANLFLSYYESKFVETPKNKKIRLSSHVWERFQIHW